MLVEANIDGLVGPTHHYAGLGLGNRASQSHRGQTSNPQAAALQGLEKAWYWARQGVPQGLIPPQQRPRLDWLRTLGFTGTDTQLVQRAYATDPALVSACYSASSMWTANAATVTPSPDTADGRLHLTPANLISGLHRSLEPDETYQWLQRAFPKSCCQVHPPLPAAWGLRDEGGANQTRFTVADRPQGLHLLVYGSDSQDTSAAVFARQTRWASQAVLLRHQVAQEQTVLLRQSAKALSAGVFHNDVISVGHESSLLVHEDAFEDLPAALDQLQQSARHVLGRELTVHIVAAQDVSLAEAVASYLFNSQWVTLPDGTQTLLCPAECQQSSPVMQTLERLQESFPSLTRIDFIDLKQSMDNGGGPACLRLRVPLTKTEQQEIDSRVWLTQDIYQQLRDAIQTHYRDRLELADLQDPSLIDEVFAAREAILGCLGWNTDTKSDGTCE